MLKYIRIVKKGEGDEWIEVPSIHTFTPFRAEA